MITKEEILKLSPQEAIDRREEIKEFIFNEVKKDVQQEIKTRQAKGDKVHGGLDPVQMAINSYCIPSTYPFKYK